MSIGSIRDLKNRRQLVLSPLLTLLGFAGEHTAPFVALGTVTGAYWSGESVAQRIANAYGMTCPGLEVSPSINDLMSTDGTKEVNVRGFADKALEK